MIDNAWVWAAARNKLRVNEVHKDEEASLILSETFQLLDECGQEVAIDGEMAVDDSNLHIHIVCTCYLADIHYHTCTSGREWLSSAVGDPRDIGLARRSHLRPSFLVRNYHRQWAFAC